jgi:hypothetical protein
MTTSTGSPEFQHHARNEFDPGDAPHRDFGKHAGDGPLPGARFAQSHIQQKIVAPCGDFQSSRCSGLS